MLWKKRRILITNQLHVSDVVHCNSTKYTTMLLISSIFLNTKRLIPRKNDDYLTQNECLPKRAKSALNIEIVMPFMTNEELLLLVNINSLEVFMTLKLWDKLYFNDFSDDFEYNI